MKLKLFLLTLVVSALLFCSGAAIEGADIVYYNSFDSATAVTAPVVGAAGTCDGAATFGEGKNGKALFVPARAVSPIKVPFANGLPAEKGCIEFWAKIEPTSNYADSCNLFLASQPGEGGGQSDSFTVNEVGQVEGIGVSEE